MIFVKYYIYGSGSVCTSQSGLVVSVAGLEQDIARSIPDGSLGVSNLFCRAPQCMRGV